MISCDTFRKRFHADADDAMLLEHLRGCDRCLDHAARIDPDVLFRSIGGEQAVGGETLLPPGGLDAFVGEVMQQVRVRDAETRLDSHRVVSWPRRLAIAATVVAGLSATLLVSRDTDQSDLLKPIAQARITAPAPVQNLTTKPIVESYESNHATIVEVPSEATDDVKIVMIFDDSLPADL